MKDPFLITISKKDLIAASINGIIAEQQADVIWEYLLQKRTPSNRLLQFTYYFGATLILLAMTYFMFVCFDNYQGLGSFCLSLIYGGFFYTSGYLLWEKKNFRLPAGLLATLALFTVPLAIYSLLTLLHLWPADPMEYLAYYRFANTNWIILEIGSILVGLIFLWYIPCPFLVMPISCFLWYLSMDCFANYDKGILSAIFGAAMLASSYLLDYKKKEEYAFWGYLFGSLTFFGSLLFLQYTSKFNWALYLIIQIGAMLIGLWIKRKILLIFGALGIFSYLSFLAYEVFPNNFLFSIGLSITGILVMTVGFLYQKNRNKLL